MAKDVEESLQNNRSIENELDEQAARMSDGHGGKLLFESLSERNNPLSARRDDCARRSEAVNNDLIPKIDLEDSRTYKTVSDIRQRNGHREESSNNELIKQLDGFLKKREQQPLLDTEQNISIFSDAGIESTQKPELRRALQAADSVPITAKSDYKITGQKIRSDRTSDATPEPPTVPPVTGERKTPGGNSSPSATADGDSKPGPHKPGSALQSIIGDTISPEPPKRNKETSDGPIDPKGRKGQGASDSPSNSGDEKGTQLPKVEFKQNSGDSALPTERGTSGQRSPEDKSTEPQGIIGRTVRLISNEIKDTPADRKTEAKQNTDPLSFRNGDFRTGRNGQESTDAPLPTVTTIKPMQNQGSPDDVGGQGRLPTKIIDANTSSQNTTPELREALQNLAGGGSVKGSSEPPASNKPAELPQWQTPPKQKEDILDRLRVLLGPPPNELASKPASENKTGESPAQVAPWQNARTEQMPLKLEAADQIYTQTEARQINPFGILQDFASNGSELLRAQTTSTPTLPLSEIARSSVQGQTNPEKTPMAKTIGDGNQGLARPEQFQNFLRGKIEASADPAQGGSAKPLAASEFQPQRLSDLKESSFDIKDKQRTDRGADFAIKAEKFSEKIDKQVSERSTLQTERSIDKTSKDSSLAANSKANIAPALKSGESIETAKTKSTIIENKNNRIDEADAKGKKEDRGLGFSLDTSIFLPAKRKVHKTDETKSTRKNAGTPEHESRKKYIVRPGDTLHSLAQTQLGDKRFALLLEMINRATLHYSWQEGVKKVVLKVGQAIWLPTAAEMKVHKALFFTKRNNVPTQEANIWQLANKADVSFGDTLNSSEHSYAFEQDASVESTRNSDLFPQKPKTIRRVTRKEKGNVIPQLELTDTHEKGKGREHMVTEHQMTNASSSTFEMLATIYETKNQTSVNVGDGIQQPQIGKGIQDLLHKLRASCSTEVSTPPERTTQCDRQADTFDELIGRTDNERVISSYSTDTLITIKESDRDRSSFVISLRKLINANWITVASYESKRGRTCRYLHRYDGSKREFVLQLPQFVVKNMAIQDLSRNHERYLYQYLFKDYTYRAEV